MAQPQFQIADKNITVDEAAGTTTLSGMKPTASISDGAYTMGTRSFNASTAGSGYLTLVGQGKEKPATGNYVVDTSARTITLLSEYLKANPPAPTKTATNISDYDAYKTPIIAILERFQNGLATATFTIPQPVNSTISLDGNSRIGKSGAWYNTLDFYNTYTKADVQNTPGKKISELINGLSAVDQGKENAVMLVVRPYFTKMFTDEIDKPESKARSFLIDGRGGFLNEGTKEKVLYDNVMLITEYIGNKAEVEAAIDAKRTGISGPVIPPSGGTTPAAPEAPPTTTPPAQGDKSANYDKAKAQIVKVLTAFADKQPAVFADTKFATGQEYNGQIKAQIAKIDAETAINPTDPLKLDDQVTLPKLGVAFPKNQIAHTAIKTLGPGEMKVEFDKPENADARALLKAHADGATTPPKDKALYDNCLLFADYLGVKEQFIQLAKGGAPTPPPPPEGTDKGGAGVLDDVKQKGEDALGAVKDAAGAAADAAAKSGSGGASGSGTTGGDVGRPVADTEDVIIYVKIDGADPSSTDDSGRAASLTFKFIAVGDPEGGPTVKTYDIQPDSFGMLVPILMTSGNRAFFTRAAKLGTPISIEVEAMPITGGKRKTLKREEKIIYPRGKMQDPPVVTFEFAPQEDVRLDKGVEADKGFGGAANFTDGAGEVQEVFWTAGDGVDSALVAVDVAAVGRTYTFKFTNRPLIVPVRIKVKKPSAIQEGKVRRLNEATVPHWLFIRPDRARREAGAGGAGGAGAGAGKGGADGEALNVAVTSIQITTDKKWISLPNTNTDWTPGSFKYTIAPGSGKSIQDQMPADAKKIMCKDDLKAAGVDFGDLEDAVERVLFKFSEAWSRRGGIKYWAKSPTVTGRRAVTARTPTQSVVRST